MTALRAPAIREIASLSPDIALDLLVRAIEAKRDDIMDEAAPEIWPVFLAFTARAVGAKSTLTKGLNNKVQRVIRYVLTHAATRPILEGWVERLARGIGEQQDLAEMIFLEALGYSCAHEWAFDIASRLIDAGLLRAEASNATRNKIVHAIVSADDGPLLHYVIKKHGLPGVLPKGQDPARAVMTAIVRSKFQCLKCLL
jgi:hypothetical protein